MKYLYLATIFSQSFIDSVANKTYNLDRRSLLECEGSTKIDSTAVLGYACSRSTSPDSSFLGFYIEGDSAIESFGFSYGGAMNRQICEDLGGLSVEMDCAAGAHLTSDIPLLQKLIQKVCCVPNPSPISTTYTSIAPTVPNFTMPPTSTVLPKPTTPTTTTKQPAPVLPKITTTGPTTALEPTTPQMTMPPTTTASPKITVLPTATKKPVPKGETTTPTSTQEPAPTTPQITMPPTTTASPKITVLPTSTKEPVLIEKTMPPTTTKEPAPTLSQKVTMPPSSTKEPQTITIVPTTTTKPTTTKPPKSMML
mmetsp:Transcript_33260/g.76751  ORF Transcript_33260/g.76751 Transcript_33260/m.76751 type:complete len:310 (-) Transcript_33260:113-1042(-)|eukprot:CAMPEP_0113300908 /NCGR_PEP_ID=MMETSP0010_2-20120614/2341_1 /TAXON_ID=216773 ORGANISM="Corethron hystrix, Strain 308" /NCGR_SAMPLE_ID=MMETSP0010_2 /ASSEMBLY_ACC=CAM_ASM_000155 /LENGTH=309 /DNA_ID=CAMNT_0000154409 /DNA_START=48 /DNA_END=977 /DNA_ORIENTATION=+ /assembly_acc=CAM_ASM_000155